jgi:hypothetical protein
VLVLFVLLTTLAVKKFRAEPVSTSNPWAQHPNLEMGDSASLPLATVLTSGAIESFARCKSLSKKGDSQMTASSPTQSSPTFAERKIPRGEHRIYVRDYAGADSAFVLMHGFPDNLGIYDRLALSSRQRFAESLPLT